jgi:hypothetical protein
MENLKALFDLTKLPAKFFFLFAVLSGFILFADAELLKRLHLEKLNDSYGWIVGLVFISTSGLVFVNSIIWTFKSISNKLTFRRIKKEYIEKLRNLDYHEKSVLREFIINQTSSLEVPIDNSTITGLINKKIIFINQQFGNGFIMNGMNASVSLSKFVDKHLKLEDIGLNNNPTEADYEFVENNRPSWVENRIRRKSLY